MSEPLVLELLARGVAVGAFLGVASLALRGARTPVRITGALFALAAASHTLTQWQGSEIAAALGWLMPVVWALSVAGSGLLWAFATELFEDRAEFDWRRFLPVAVLFAIGLGTLLAPQPQVFMFAHKLVSGALLVHTLILVAKGWRNDLVESRRRLRGPILVLASVYALGVISVEAGELVVGSASALSPLAAGAPAPNAAIAFSSTRAVERVARGGSQAAFVFPQAAFRELMELDPRESVELRIINGRTGQTLFVEVGDIAAARAFLTMPGS